MSLLLSRPEAGFKSLLGMSLPTEKCLHPHADSSSVTGSDQLLRALHHAEPLEQQGPLVPYTAISRVPFWGGGLVPYTANSRIFFGAENIPCGCWGFPPAGTTAAALSQL